MFFQPSYHHFIATDGSVEVDQRLLQLHQLQEVFVADAFLQLFFGGGHIVVYLFQILQEPDGGRVDDSQNQSSLLLTTMFFRRVCWMKSGISSVW